MSRKRHLTTSGPGAPPDPELFDPMLAHDAHALEGTHVVRDRLLGQVLHGAELVSVIGEGSAARVYRARHVVLEREYAVKVLSIPHAQKEDLVERFYREARALSRMVHPNIVGVVDSGTTSEGRPFLTMELLEGETLQARIDRVRLSREAVIDIASQILAGLAEAHRRGLVHRDLKPANVMLVPGADGRETAKLLDFGIARLTDAHRESPTLTAGEMLLGTPRYMAPEQVMNAADASARSDLYSFGVVLYEMLAGRAPFEGGMMDVLDKQFHASPPALATDSGLEPIVFRLLEKDPDRRPRTADEVLAAIDRAERITEREPTIRFADNTGIAYVDRTEVDDDRVHDTLEDDAWLPEVPLEGPTLLEAKIDPSGPLPFDDSEETMPSGVEPTVLRVRPRSLEPNDPPTNLRIFDGVEEETYEALVARPTDVDGDARDTDPDPPPIPTRVVESPLSLDRTAETHPLALMALALVLAFGVTLIVGAAVQAHLGVDVVDVYSP